MANDDPIRQKTPGSPERPEGSPEAGGLRCEEWEGLAAEALDGGLSDAQAAALEQHCLQCPSCSQTLEQSRRGAQWLRFLEERPQPPAGLVEAILVATSGTASPHAPAQGLAQRPAFRGRYDLPSSRRSIAPSLSAPGLLMTTAMAFFSLALTVYLLTGPTNRSSLAGTPAAGAPLADLHLSDLSPSAVSMMAVRQYYSLQERGAKFYDNLLLVREVEAEVRDLSASDQAQPEDGGTAPGKLGKSPTSRNGSTLLRNRSRSREVATEGISDEVSGRGLTSGLSLDAGHDLNRALNRPSVIASEIPSRIRPGERLRAHSWPSLSQPYRSRA